jgi:hypothetical protein
VAWKGTVTKTKNKKLKFSVEDLRKLNPCHEALAWVDKQHGESPSDLWQMCPRSDWMLWLLARVRPLSKPEAVTLACRFALKVLTVFETRYPYDKRPRQAIEAAQACLKDPSASAAYAAASAASAAYAAAADAAAADASAAAAAYAAADAAADASAYASAYAAYAADAAADAADAAAYAYAADAADASAAYAADAAADAADAAADAAAARKKQADIIREIIGNPFK